MSILAKTIDDFRQETNPKLTKEQMAKRMGISYVSYLRHEHNPDTYTYWKLAAWCIKHNIDQH